MRITNKVMQNNALSNINRNKVLQDDLNNQIATGKKIMTAGKKKNTPKDISGVARKSTKDNNLSRK